MSSSGPNPRAGREQRQRGLHVDPDVAGAEGGRGGVDRQFGAELVVDEQRPDVVEADLADQVVDVDAAVAQRPAVPVGFGDGGVERHHAFEAGDEAGTVGRHVKTSTLRVRTAEVALTELAERRRLAELDSS